MGYCRKHHSNYKRTGYPEGIKKIKSEEIKTQICCVDNCDHPAEKRNKDGKVFCVFHYRRYNSGSDLNRPKGIKGELNPRWNNGTSEYQNHYEMKKNRKIILKMNNYKCSVCGGTAKIVHHKDGTKHNHDLNNLLPLCYSCHHKTMKKRTTKYVKIYGMTLFEIAAILEVTPTTVMAWHNKGILKDKYFLITTPSSNATG